MKVVAWDLVVLKFYSIFESGEGWFARAPIDHIYDLRLGAAHLFCSLESPAPIGGLWPRNNFVGPFLAEEELCAFFFDELQNKVLVRSESPAMTFSNCYRRILRDMELLYKGAEILREIIVACSAPIPVLAACVTSQNHWLWWPSLKSLGYLVHIFMLGIHDKWSAPTRWL